MIPTKKYQLQQSDTNSEWELYNRVTGEIRLGSLKVLLRCIIDDETDGMERIDFRPTEKAKRIKRVAGQAYLDIDMADADD